MRYYGPQDWQEKAKEQKLPLTDIPLFPAWSTSLWKLNEN
jgi:hypothetical protein